MPRMIADTPEGVSWLEQFQPSDLHAARFLLSSLLLISNSEFERTLFNLVDGIRKEEWRKAGNRRPIALYGIRKVSPENPFFDPDDPEKRPQSVEPGDVGSEGRVASLLTSLRRGNEKGFLYNPSLHAIKSTRCRVIALVDDIIGSGQRATEFLTAIYKHTTIKSWHSYKKIRFIIVAFGATSSGLDAIRHTRPGGVRVRYAHRVAYGQDWWQNGDRLAVETVCKKSAVKTTKPGIPFGYRNCLTMIVFAHGCPNTAPAVLHAGQAPGTEGTGWKALFTKSPLSANLESCFNPQSDARLSRWQEILRNPVDPLHPDAVSRAQVLVVLKALATKRRDPERISGYTGLNIEAVREILVQCRTAQFATWNNRLTAAGLRELRYARSSKGKAEEAVDLATAFYYPRSLRGA